MAINEIAGVEQRPVHYYEAGRVVVGHSLGRKVTSIGPTWTAFAAALPEKTLVEKRRFALMCRAGIAAWYRHNNELLSGTHYNRQSVKSLQNHQKKGSEEVGVSSSKNDILEKLGTFNPGKRFAEADKVDAGPAPMTSLTAIGRSSQLLST